MGPSPQEQTAQILWDPLQRVGSLSATRRTGIACAFCRARKVKCNRLEDQPCTNCVFENVQCKLLPKQKRHRRARNTTAPNRSWTPTNGAQSQATVIATEAGPTETNEQPATPDPASDERLPETGTTIDASAPVGGDEQSSQHFGDDDMDWREAAVEAMPQRPLNPSTSPSLPSPHSVEGSELRSPSLPSFLKPPASSLGKQDLDYLARKGALDVPERELRDALIESYILFIHPCYPIIDLDLLEETLKCGSDHRFSFSVFQAIMFAGSSWVDVKLLRRLGYLSRWAARKALYSKVRLLYDADYEEDQLCQLQTLVLLSLWWKGPPNEAKDGWHWLGLAISLARTMGLHQDASSRHLDAKSRALRRRLWWSCTIRDTFASFSANRVPRILDADFKVAPLTLLDFEGPIEGRADHTSSWAQKSIAPKQLATICSQTAALCRIITRVLLAAYHETSTGNIGILYNTSTPEGGKSNVEPTKLQRIDEEFRAWQSNVQSEILHLGTLTSPPSRTEQAVLVHRALLSILYHSGFIMLHRQRDSTPPSHVSPRELVRDASRQVNKIIMDMYVTDLMKDMPPTVISLLFPVSMSHILDTKHPDPKVRDKGRQKLEECKQALRELCDGQLAAEWAVNFLVKLQVHVMKSSSTPSRGQTFSKSEQRTIQTSDIGGREQSLERGWVSSHDSRFLPSGDDCRPQTQTYPSQLTFVRTPGNLVGMDDAFDWTLFDTQWNAIDIDQFEQGAMAMGSFEVNFGQQSN